MMEKRDHKANLIGFRAELVNLETDLTRLDIEREEIRKQIEHTKRIIANLAVLCGETQEDFGSLGFTDACREILSSKHPKGLTATGVRDHLMQRGYNLAPYANPLASIYTILKRLEVNGQAYRFEKNGKVFYKWKERGKPPFGTRGKKQG